MPLNIGVVGCGNISEVYLDNLQNLFPATRVTAVTDLDPERAAARAQQFGVPHVAPDVESLVARDDVDIVVNLTIPTQHAAVSRKALRAGKHVYSEKPMATDLREAEELVDLASDARLLLCVAPDTVLGTATQTAHAAIRSGLIGTPFAFTAHLLTSGAAAWHPNPEFLYKEGAGPVFDYAPYPLADIVYLLGSVERVAMFGSRPVSELRIGSGPRAGELFPVEIDTFVASCLELETGASGTMGVSMSVRGTGLGGPRQASQGLEIYGTEGTIILPPSPQFGGEVLHRAAAAESWTPLPSVPGFSDNARGLGVADLAESIMTATAPQLSTEYCYHLFEVQCALAEAGRTGGVQTVTSRASGTRPLSPLHR